LLIGASVFEGDEREVEMLSWAQALLFQRNLWRVLVTDRNQLVKGMAFKELKAALVFWALRFVNTIDRYTRLHNVGLPHAATELFPTGG
jgi:flagellar biosynthesis regulator FlaF